MVFPQGRQPPQSNNSFPVFTYMPARAQEVCLSTPGSTPGNVPDAPTPPQAADEADGVAQVD